MHPGGIFIMKGFTKIDNKSLFSKELGVYTKLVLMGLTYFTRNGTGKCFCRKSTMASYLNLSLYQVRCGLVELEEKGLINIKRVRQGNPDIITLNDLTIKNENPSSSFHYIEEEVKEEEENNLSTKNVDSITPKEDEPALDKHLEPETPKISPNSGHQQAQTPPTKPKHLHTLKTITTKIKPLLRDNSYNHFISYNNLFSNISVIDETNDTISLATPNDEIIANFIQEQYSSKLGKILGKDVKISSVLQNK